MPARVILLAFLGMLAVCARARADDAFLLALGWQPSFCAAGNHAGLAECKAETAPRLVLHGLWPDWDANGDGKHNADDDFCVRQDRRQAVIAADNASGMAGDWRALPAVELTPASHDDLDGVMPGAAAGLERHEWMKHGTCSGMKADDYFATAILLTREVERTQLAKLLVAQAGGDVARQALLDAFAADFGKDATRALTLDCTKAGGVSRLAEIRIRLRRAMITEGLTAENIGTPERAAKGDCAAEISVPRGPAP